MVRTVCVCFAVAMSLADIFLTGSGFGIYLNNRTWIEGWDVELALKRLAARLRGTAAVLVGGWLAFFPAKLDAASTDAAETIREVKADPAFEVHTVIDRVADSSASSGSWNLHPPAWLADVFVVAAIGLLLGLLGWLLWKYRHTFVRTGGEDERAVPKVAKIVMGLEVSPESLPEDVPGTALRWWREGRCHDALGLLYRGAIAHVIRVARVAIDESDTEGDCQRRVDAAGEVAHPRYFRSLTAAWMAVAYAGGSPADAEVERLCAEWPFEERRRA